ncbi:hypothetical protein SAMN05920897_101320 [Alkalispirochaeta americana]|uniref:Uncharacterized protein n=1 Tax=Alkalispirochaeta americana TaxID=159291 RepID=A0A1N6NLY8_9SPIO|nr:hypothetical protein SAMN05920897_101320 [Alkalispirochaeta americana]
MTDTELGNRKEVSTAPFREFATPRMRGKMPKITNSG